MRLEERGIRRKREVTSQQDRSCIQEQGKDGSLRVPSAGKERGGGCLSPGGWSELAGSTERLPGLADGQRLKETFKTQEWTRTGAHASEGRGNGPDAAETT